MNKAVIFALSLLVFFPVLSKAQADLSLPGQMPEIQEQISTTVDPSIPTPGQPVTITLEAYGTDLNRAVITWTYNGKEALKGTGETKFVFTASQIGKADAITATIQPFNGPVITKTFNFSPSEIDLLWEASTYTPPFYKGKALFTPEADVLFVAMPNMISKGSRVSPSQTVYKWRTDFVVEGDKSGYGRDTFKYTGAIILRPHNFQVDGYAANDPSVTATSRILLEASDPVVNIYEEHPLYGILFNKALFGSFRMDAAEKRISVYPFFFSTSDKNINITYQWNVNDSVVQVPSNQSAMSFRKTEKDTGNATVGLKVDSTSKLLQEAFAGVSLYFDSNDSIFLKQ